MQDSTPITWKGRLISSCIGLVILLIFAEIILRIAMPHWQDFFSGRFMRVIDVPGHGRVSTGLPDFDGYFAQNNGDFRVHIKINEFGLRNDEPIDKADRQIWVVGDSMTFGWGVEQNEIYSSVIADLLDSDTYNIASPGTSICGYQALLARMPKELKPRAVVMGLVLENDVGDYSCNITSNQKSSEPAETPEAFSLNISAIKRFLTENTATYNFMAVSLKRINIAREILSAVGIVLPAEVYRKPLYGGDFDKSVEASVNEIARFQEMLPTATPFLVVIAPGRFELNNGDPLYTRLRQTISQALTDRGIVAVDPFLSFKQAGYGPTHFAHDGHWTPLGHQLAGKAISERLSKMLKE